MSGIELIAAERERQVSVEGWTPEHDDAHIGFEMEAAAVCYAESANCTSDQSEVPELWPWDDKWWKPSDDPIRNLVKAGALIAAEIDRLQRKLQPIPQSLPITSGSPQNCPMPGCGGETEMAFYANQNVFWIRCKKNPLCHNGPHRESEAAALAAWNTSQTILKDTELLLDLERKDTAYLKERLEAARKGFDRLRAMANCFGVSDKWNRDEVLEVCHQQLAALQPPVEQTEREWRVVWGEIDNRQYWADCAFIGTEGNADSFIAARADYLNIRKQFRTKEIAAGPWTDAPQGTQEEVDGK